MPMQRCFKVHAADNVATMLDDAGAGNVSILGSLDSSQTIALLEPIKLGHKIALSDLRPGQAVVKFGVSIGHATCPVRAGQWVHLHNLASDFDQRSQTLDLHTGGATDTKYE
jgi:altronate dehydratase small subunit